MPPRFEHEHDDEHEDDLVADLGVSSVERYAALRLCGESPSGPLYKLWPERPAPRTPKKLLSIWPQHCPVEPAEAQNHGSPPTLWKLTNR